MRYQKVEVQTWNDEKFTLLSPQQKYLFLYLLTTPHSNCLGAFVLKPGYAADDMGWVRETVTLTLSELFRKGFLNLDETLSLIVIKNYLKHNPPENPNQFKAMCKALAALPKSSALNPTILYLQGFTERFNKPLPEGFMKPFPEPLPKPEAVTEAETVTEIKAAAINHHCQLEAPAVKGVVEEKQDEHPTEERLPVSEALKLMRVSLGRLTEVPGQVVVLQDICRLYPPELIREAFTAARVAGATRLNWVVQRLAARGRDSPASTKAEAQRQRNYQAAREFCGEEEETHDAG